MRLFQLFAMFAWILGLCVVPRPRRHQRNRRKRPTVSQTLTFTAEFTTPNIVLTFTSPVVLASGLKPQFLTDTGKLPTSASQTSPTSITLVYDTPGSVTEITVPQDDPAIRSSTGGFCSPGTFPAS